MLGRESDGFGHAGYDQHMDFNCVRSMIPNTG